MSCDCLDNFNAQLEPHNLGVESQSVWTRREGRDPVTTTRVKLATYKCEPNKKPKDAVFPTFCPFCGLRYVPGELPHD